ncbi:Uncharacterized protein OS=Isosphaera pallida (strain ATCC 43644 / DSM 9630 / IS1B) GN=Isop_2427 PE=4 SV=1 [Gemmata massiliana]|uniref:Uncharacterized protein n=1 Tax=Gemmata massiliana TaxID=1210884 RepID=A0A6P2DKC5_9BACT|nr:hypothetical protein [Gemmata massiliana]VTS03830.1 Uncharacterized protein OS=Isosphaera pallida (strain ATCC 43644 / DSM 9630 / IS1B) GN=Isop_2427 PE=4 SV=1 [Gemmata massiliana]
MRSFKDGAGRTWDVSIDAWLIKQVESRTGFKIGTLLDNNMVGFEELVKSPVLFVDVLFVLCGDQAAKFPVTEEQFFRGLTGDALEAAYEAFREAFISFCPSHQRKILRAVTEKAKSAQDLATERVLQKIESLDLLTEPSASTSSISASETPGSPASAHVG